MSDQLLAEREENLSRDISCLHYIDKIVTDEAALKKSNR
jgi:hypothetical protein